MFLSGAKGSINGFVAPRNAVRWSLWSFMFVGLRLWQSSVEEYEPFVFAQASFRQAPDAGCFRGGHKQACLDELPGDLRRKRLGRGEGDFHVAKVNVDWED